MLLNNAHFKRKKTMQRFLPRRRRVQTPEQIEAAMMHFARLHNARIEREKNRG